MSRNRNAGRPDEGGRRLSHDVRVWKIRTNVGKKAKTYSVRWTVDGQEHHETFATYSLADGYRAKLVSYQRRGTPFDSITGLPEPMLRERQQRSWYDHACQFATMKWPHLAPMSRKSVAETLAAVTPALLATARAAPEPAMIRKAMYSWALIPPRREAAAPGCDIATTLQWLERHTATIGDLQDPTRGPVLVRAALDMLATRIDGKPAAANTIARRRAILYNALEYAVEQGLLAANPIDYIGWRTPKTTEAVDRRSVVNRRQADALLCAVALQPGVAPRLVAFFALIYYAALRPSEIIGLRESNLGRLPRTGWGELLLERSAPRTGLAWSNTGKSREAAALKHRAVGETRPVPAHPALVALLRTHIETFGVAPDGRLFTGPQLGQIEEATYLRVWRTARTIALTPAEVASPLAARPYDLRHAAVSTWLNAGVPPTQVAEWAGHSVAVLLRVYAKCIVGQGEGARRRIEIAMDDDALGTPSGS